MNIQSSRTLAVPSARARWVRRGLAVSTVTLASLITASPASALTRDGGDEPGSGLSVQETLFWFVAVPGLIIAVVWLLTYAPSMARGTRQRPGSAWAGGPVWFNGPAGGNATQAVATAEPIEGQGGFSGNW